MSQTILTLIFIIICLVVLSALFLIFIFNKKIDDKIIKDDKLNERERKKLPCIICGSLLYRGDKLHSVAYPATDGQIVHIFGCPYCYGDNAANKRVCPICKKK